MGEYDDVARLYASMRTDELEALQWAFESDQDEAISAKSITFIAGRLALIAAELRKRVS